MKVGPVSLGKKVLLTTLAFLVALTPLAPAASAAEAYTLVRSGNNIDIDWDDEVSATEYTVDVYEDDVKTETVSTGTISSFQDVDILPNVSYRYDVSVTKPIDIENPEQTETNLLLQTTAVNYALTTLKTSISLASYNSIKLNITPVYGVDSYEIYRSAKKTSGFKKIASTTTSSYTDKSLALNTTYYYKVRGVQKVGSKVFYTNTTAALSKKTALGKTTLKLKSLSHNAAKLTWTSSQGATKYEVYRSTSRTKGFKKITTTSSLSYTNKSLSTGQSYYYKIKPMRGSAAGPTSNTISAKPHLSKTQITRIDLGLGKATVRWSKVSGASGYKVYRATSKNGSYKHLKTTKSTSYANTGLSSNKAYYYKVKPYRMVGKKAVYAGSSAAVKTVTPRKAGMYRYYSNTFVVLTGNGYYSVCQKTKCDWYNGDFNGNFENRAYVVVPAGWYLTYDPYTKNAAIIDADYYYVTRKTSFTKGGDYIVGVDLKSGRYKLSSNDDYYYSVCTDFYINCSLADDEFYNDYVNNGAVRYLMLNDGDILSVSSFGASKFKGVRY